MNRFPLLSVALAVSTAIFGCQRRGDVSTPRDAGKPRGRVLARSLATVNGKPIFDHDVRHWLRKNTGGRIGEGTPEQTKNALEALIAQELESQEAERLGLDRSRQYRSKLRAKQAEIDSLRRTELRRLYRLHLAREAAEVTPDEARAYFDEHVKEIGTGYHVQRILKRSEREIQAAKGRLDEGVPFEKLAQDAAGRRREGRWDLGFVAWLELPEDWRAVVEKMNVGDVSGILTGSGRRFWILRLVDKKVDPGISFENARLRVIANLRERRIRAQRERAEEKLRSSATIVYSLPDSPAP